MLSAITQKITSLIVAAGSLFLSSVTGTNAVFTDVEIIRYDNKIVCSATLSNCFNEELDKIFLSGEIIRINFVIQTFEKGNKEPIDEKNFYHHIKYDLVDQYFEIYLSETDNNFVSEDITESKTKLAKIEEFEVIKTDLLELGRKYYIKLTAEMESIYLDALHKNIDLMIYWNNKNATLKTKLFEKSILKL